MYAIIWRGGGIGGLIPYNYLVVRVCCMMGPVCEEKKGWLKTSVLITEKYEETYLKVIGVKCAGR